MRKKKDKYEIIYKLKTSFRLSTLFQIANVKRASYYKAKNAKVKTDDCEQEIVQLFNQFDARQGVLQLKASMLRHYNKIVNHKKIRAIMHKYNLICKVRRSKKAKGVIENRIIKENILNRQFVVSEPNKFFVTDFSYINVLAQTYYLSVIIDLFDKRPIVWYISSKCDKTLSLNTIELLEKKVNLEEVLIHSDQGIQYTCSAYVELLASKKVIQSMSRKGNCWDNAVVENFFGIIKTESIYRYPARCRTIESLTELLEEEIEYYINERPQKSLGGIPPKEYRDSYYNNKKN